MGCCVPRGQPAPPGTTLGLTQPGERGGGRGQASVPELSERKRASSFPIPVRLAPLLFSLNFRADFTGHFLQNK